MNYLTTSEAAKKWGLTSSRVLKLAKGGRIPGTVQIGTRWMIPGDAEKPADARTRAGRTEKKKEPDSFRYPVYEYKDVSSFSPPLSRDELTLKALTEAFNACRFQDADALLGDLPRRTKNRYIRISALYCGCMTGLFTGSMEQFLGYYGRLKAEMQEDFPHKSEMIEYLHELEATLGADDYYSSEFHAGSTLDYHESFLPRLCNLSSLWIALGSKPVTPADLSANEIICRFLAGTDNYFDLQAVHVYLACAYSMTGRDEECRYHFTQALELAKKYDMFYTIASMQFYYTPESLEAALAGFPDDFKNRVSECNRLVHGLIVQFTDALQFNSIYNLLRGKYYIYLVFAAQGLTNKEVARRLHKSIGAIGKHYGEIYAMLGVKNKAGAVSLYRTLVPNSDLL